MFDLVSVTYYPLGSTVPHVSYYSAAMPNLYIEYESSRVKSAVVQT